MHSLQFKEAVQHYELVRIPYTIGEKLFPIMGFYGFGFKFDFDSIV